MEDELKRLRREVEELKKANELTEELRAKEYNDAMSRVNRDTGALLRESEFLQSKSDFLEDKNNSAKTEIKDLKKIIMSLVDGGSNMTPEMISTIERILEEFKAANDAQSIADAQFARDLVQSETTQINADENLARQLARESKSKKSVSFAALDLQGSDQEDSINEFYRNYLLNGIQDTSHLSSSSTDVFRRSHIEGAAGGGKRRE
jgi:hypothetical protein